MPQAWRATLFAVALYMIIGANLPYLPVWMEQSRGLSGAAIAGAVSLATLLRIVAGPLAAVWAAQTGLRRTLAALSLILVGAYALLTPDSPAAAVFLIVSVAYVAWGAAMPLSEAVLIAATRTGRPDYGLARACGSAAFILASLAVGALIRRFGPDAALYWLIAAALLTLAAALYLREPKQSLGDRPSFAETARRGAALYRDRRILAAGLASALIQSSHAHYYNFGSTIWLRQGIGEVEVGLLWSTGVLVEIALLAASARLFGRWTAGGLMLLGGLGAVLRWTLAGFLPALDALYLLQTLHALSFAATHLGLVRFLADELAERDFPIAMSVNTALGFGPLMALGGFLGGLVYDAQAGLGAAGQAQGYWLMAVMAALGSGFALFVLRRRQPQSAALGGETRPPA